MLRLVIQIVVACVFLYLFFRWCERANLWAPSKTFYGTPRVVDLDYEDVYFETEDGIRLNGWHVPCENPAAAMLFCHGNGGNISYRTESLRQYHSLNLNVFIFDYRGYGKSRGRLTEEGTYRDAAAAYRWLVEKNPDLPVIIFGRSLGANIAVDLAARVEAAGLIYESGFNSTLAIGREIFPYLPVRWIVKYHYDALGKIQNVRMPILVIHSRDDEIVPFHHGKKLFDAAPPPKRFFEIHGGHNDGFIASEEIYLKELQLFIDEFVLQTDSIVKTKAKGE
ncbi:MAG: alpha/beta hydrolase [Candidatus Omnitrophica bacterium]|nr:alpha/beta hydrolase [Candidatus Omnitrophota bacterium]